MFRTFALLCASLITITMTASAGTSESDHAVRSFPLHMPVGSKLPSLGLPIDTSSTYILVRYLGFSCTHCVRQLTYLNSYAQQLQAAGIRVVAFSTDDARTNQRLIKRMGYDTSVITLVPDVSNRIADALNLRPSMGDTLYDLHAAIVVRKGIVTFGISSTEPFMDVSRLVQAAIEPSTSPIIATGSLAHYSQGSVRPRVIASAADGIVSPVDLKFNRSILHNNDLWVVTSPDVAAGMAIIHNAGMPQQQVTLKRDSRASHFMYRTQALAFGTNGTFATAQSGWEGNGYPRYMFMGPTLWSSDTAIFASLYQDARDRLASHLDMLHQSPFCLGIAHERDNVYWVSDARYKTIHRYDFADPHEVGGTDHRDGVIRRYAEATLTATDRDQPAHMAIDHATGWLYYVDPGAKSVRRLRITSGSATRQLEPPEESDEWLAEFSEVRGAVVETAIVGPLGQPVGLDIKDGMMIVGDRSTGRINMYRLSEAVPELVGSVMSGAGELLGITIGPDDHIWCVDRANATVLRLETSPARVSMAVATDVMVVSDSVESDIVVTLVNDSDAPVTFRLASSVGSGWNVPSTLPDVTVPAATTERTTLRIRRDSNALPSELRINATATMQTSQGETHAPIMGARVHVVPSNLRRVLVLDGTTEGFDCDGAISATSREGYVAMSSLVFNRAAASLHRLETCLWYSGSFGDINVTDEAVISDLRQRNVDMLMLADDPLAIRAEGSAFAPFFALFGALYGGIDAPSGPEDGRRLFDGVANDPVSNGITLVDCQLPRLDHQRGRLVVPNVFFRSGGTGSSVMFTNRNTNRAMAIRHEQGSYRSIIMGINPARMLDEGQRTMILDKAIEWLEGGATTPREPDPDPDPTSVGLEQQRLFSLRLHTNPVRTSTRLTLSADEYVPSASVALYSVGGQELRRLYSGSIAERMEIPIDVSTLAAGTYFVIVRTDHAIQHLPLVKD